MKKRTAALFLALALVLGTGVGAFAAANNETISALLSRDITVTYNGEAQTLKDAAGNVVYPIAYNGTTYLPVRAVAGLVGLPVDYDAATKTVKLGKTEKQPTALTSLKNSGGTKYSWVINDKAELSIVGSDATQVYQTGIQWDIWNNAASVGEDRVVNFEVSGYSEVTFAAWSDVASKVFLYDQDFKVISSFDLTKGSIVSKTIAIPAGTTQIAFGADGAGYGKDYDGTLKILDPTVK